MAFEDTTDTAIDFVQTARVRYRSGTDQYWLSLTEPIRDAGLGAGDNFRYHPAEVEALGLVPAVGSAQGESGLSREARTYSVIGEGETGGALRLQIPEDALEALGVDTDPDQHDRSLPLLEVYTGDYLLAFGRAESRVIPADYLPDDLKHGDEKITLELIQTTKPRVHSEDLLSVALTPALKRAGIKTSDHERNEREYSIIEFLPIPEGQDSNFVPAVVRPEGNTGKTDVGTVRSIYRGANGQVLYVSLPSKALRALDVSITDCERNTSDQRPVLGVYEAQGVLGFSRLR